MAYEIGVASDHVDLWNKLLAFLTTNPALVATGENWTIGWQAPVGAPNETDCVVVGPGMGGADQIYVGLRRVDNPDAGHYSLHMRGMTGLLTGATGINDHVHTSTLVAVYLNNSPMSYWFVANGRRFAAVIKISTVYESLYCGLFLPYADPLQYSYPLFIGGSVSQVQALNTSLNWTSTAGQHSNFTFPQVENVQGYVPTSSAHLLTPSSAWNYGRRGSEHSTFSLHPMFLNSYLGATASDNYPLNAYSVYSNITQAIGGGHILTPYTIFQDLPEQVTFGVLDGVHWVPSFENASENVIEVDGVNHLVFQNVFRSGLRNLSALALE